MLILANSTNSKLDLRALGEPRTTWPSEIKSATDWFCLMFPMQIKVFGSPFLEKHEPSPDSSTCITPLVPNLDCLAACLGGDDRLGHRVIYYVSELQFYFYDPRSRMYHATTAEKLGNLMRGLLARCASEIKGEAHLFNIFHTFRSDAVIKSVVNRCKSVLAADPDFFGINSPHQRLAGPELHQRLAMAFAEQMLEACPGSNLSVAQAYTLFNRFAATRNMAAIKRSDFKSLMADVIRDAYGLGVRNDLRNAETQKQQSGWLGLRPVGADVLVVP
jgi:hypothetical protein